MRSALAVLFILALAAGPAFAATFTVTNTDDAGPGSLRQAVLDANAATTADTIVFDPAVFSTPRTITLASEIRISDNFNNVDSLTIIGPGSHLLTISGNGVSRIFLTIQRDTASISGMTLTRGNANGGGAISNGGVTTLTDIVFTQNTSNNGGAIYNSGTGTNDGTTSGVLNILRCTFRNNTTTGTNINGNGGSALFSLNGVVNITDSEMTGGTTRGGGGAIRASGGVMNITSTVISNNTSGGAGNGDGGGAIYSSAQLKLTDCTVSGNTAGEGTDGGGIVNEHQLLLIRSIVTGNSAGSHGGGISHGATSTDDFFRAIDSTVSNNTAGTATASRGGGIYGETGAVMNVTGATISGNRSSQDGGGIWTDAAITIDNSTVSGNTATRDFGGIRVPHTTDSTVTNSTIVNNTATTGGGIGRNNCNLGCSQLSIGSTIIANNTGGNEPDVRNRLITTTHSRPITSLGYNLIKTLGDNVYFTRASGDITGIDPNLSSLQHNGGPTRMHALLPGSPAIDKGRRLSDLTTDQRGVVRPTDDPAIANAEGGDGSDIGAYEIGELARTAQVWVDVIGRSRMRKGFPQTYHIVFGNRGNVDAPAAIARANVTTGVIQVKSAAPLPDGSEPLVLENENGTTSVIFFVPELAAGATHTQTMKLVSPVDVPDSTSPILVRLRSSQGIEAAAYPTDADPTAALTFLEVLEQTETSVRARFAATSSKASGEVDFSLSSTKIDTEEPFSATVTPTGDGVVYTSTTTRPAKAGSGFERIALTASMSQAAAEVLRELRIDRQAQAKYGNLAREVIKTLLEPQFPQQDQAQTVDPNFAPVNGRLLTALGERLDALAIGMGLSEIFQVQRQPRRTAAKDLREGDSLDALGSSKSDPVVADGQDIWPIHLYPMVWEDAPTSDELLTNELLINTQTLVQEATSLDELETYASDDIPGGGTIGPEPGPSPGPSIPPGGGGGGAGGGAGGSGGGGGSASATMFLNLITARDPNEKVGASGVSPQHFVTGLDPLRYAIYFENVATASAPAQEVHITDQLDVSKFDLATFELGPVHFGENVVVTPPSGLRNWTTDIDLRPANNLIVRVTAGLDEGSGVATWSFISLDPATMEPTEDPAAGFLPPNKNGPEGDGGVAFTIKAKQGLGEGTEIRNKARIVFDRNAPIETGEWLNTIDNEPPSSSVTALPATHASSSFEVKWSGSDSASGVTGYTIYVSENGGPYILWLANTTLTGATFQGRPGATYTFYSVAHDGAGHTERPPGPGDAFTLTLSGKLLNISTRMKVETGDNVLIGGLIISGTDPKRVIIRALGPSLSQFVSGALADPVLELYQANTLLATNDNWRETQPAEIEASTIPPGHELESAIVYDLTPGFYTAVMRGKDGGTGIGVIEAYDLDQAANSTLANISSRGFVQSGDDVMIGGVIAGGNGGADTRVLIRALGPSLANAGITNALQDPSLELRNPNGELVLENDNWQQLQQAAIESTTIPPPHAAESAIVATLPPGSYTAIVRGKNGTTGVGVVEVYNVP